VNSPASNAPIAVTAGEPAGIGPELCLALAQSRWTDRLVVVADPETLADRAERLDQPLAIHEFDPADPGSGAGGALRVMPQRLPAPRVCGRPDPANAEALLKGIRRAVAGCTQGTFAALVTAPVQKSAINDAGIPFTGHTEFLAGLLSVPTPVMLLVGGGLRVALATTHLPLRQVPEFLTAERLERVIEVLHSDLERLFRIANPRITVCGLNPHAGEGGHLGREELDVIRPVVEALRARGLDVNGPVPADTAFVGAADTCDAVLAMYHDQGLPVLKYAGFGKAVNVTLGLPIVRTSVDHGTALDIAGTGRADPGSLLAAVDLAAELCHWTPQAA
jgi:4-hydroxythreonine-4-phosphate dehydrogenase